MLEEAVALMRRLWEGELTSWEGRHYRVVDARLYTVPEEPIEVVVAAGGPAAAELAGRIGDGLVVDRARGRARRLVLEGRRPRASLRAADASASPSARRTRAGRRSSGGRTRGCGARSAQELPLPSDFEQAIATVDEETIAQYVVCGPDPDAHLEGIRKFADAGFDHVYVHQVGPDQESFFDFYATDVLPEAEAIRSRGEVARA